MEVKGNTHKSSKDMQAVILELEKKHQRCRMEHAKRGRVFIEPVRIANIREHVQGIMKRYMKKNFTHKCDEEAMVQEYANWIIDRTAVMVGGEPRYVTFEPFMLRDGENYKRMAIARKIELEQHAMAGKNDD